MKKIIIIIILFLISGCSNETLYINQELVKNIKYNDVNLIDNDFENVIDEINLSKFKKGDIDGNFDKSLRITTNNDLYIFNISNEGIKYTKDNVDYYTKDLSVYNTLEEIEKKYKKEFYTIEYVENYDFSENDSYIKLNPEERFFILRTNTTLYDFKINEIEPNPIDNTVFMEVNLLYAVEKIENNKIVIRSDEDIKISFKNQYGYEATIMPYNQDGKVLFKTIYNQKK